MTLAAKELAVGYGARVVASGIDLVVEPGEVLCLLGPNGGGKTTLLRTLLGLLRPLGGRVTVDDRDAATLSRAELARHLAYVPQIPMSAFPFTVRDMTLMGRAARLSPLATPSAEDRRVADAALATLGVAHLADRAFTEISGGERQLTLIARALAQEAGIVIMDEPTASLDFGNQARVLGRVRALADAGHSVILTTHDPNHTFLCADRVAILHQGRLADLGAPEEVVTGERLRQVYGVDVVVTHVPAFGRSAAAQPLTR